MKKVYLLALIVFLEYGISFAAPLEYVINSGKGSLFFKASRPPLSTIPVLDKIYDVRVARPGSSTEYLITNYTRINSRKRIVLKLHRFLEDLPTPKFVDLDLILQMITMTRLIEICA